MEPEEDSSRPAVLVVGQKQSTEIQRHNYLANCSGSCFAQWADASDVERAGFILALFNLITMQDRIPSDKVHGAFMEIEEYAEFHSGAPENRDNPFWKLYYAAV